MFEEKDRLETPEHVGVDFEIAGPMSRFAAGILDMGIIFGAFLLVILGAALLQGNFGNSDIFGAAVMIALASVVLLYFPVLEILMRGQTPGKRALGIRVARQDGLPLDRRSIILRSIGRVVDMQPGILYVVGILVMTLHRRALRVGDMMAGTWVVRERVGTEAYAALGRKEKRGAPPRNDPATAVPGAAPPAGRLTPQEHEVVGRFLARRLGLDPEARRRVARDLARPIAVRLGERPLDAEGFLQSEHARGMEGGPR
jgi:uncharacterized RDD family membrane protein YckC